MNFTDRHKLKTSACRGAVKQSRTETTENSPRFEPQITRIDADFFPLRLDRGKELKVRCRSSNLSTFNSQLFLHRAVAQRRRIDADIFPAHTRRVSQKQNDQKTNLTEINFAQLLLLSVSKNSCKLAVIAEIDCTLKLRVRKKFSWKWRENCHRMPHSLTRFTNWNSGRRWKKGWHRWIAASASPWKKPASAFRNGFQSIPLHAMLAGISQSR